jgi:release factor glutamine methyltransferase
MKSSIAQALLQGTQILNSAGVPESRRNAVSLLGEVIGKDRTFLIAHSDDLLKDSEVTQFQTLIARRSKGEPLQYITGFQDFYGRTFKVNPDVLIPRPETELLVEAALELLGDADANGIVCDVGTGSGCIVISLLCERHRLRGIALDISERALQVARINAKTHEVEQRISFIASDCFQSLNVNCKFDLIVSNPPYVSLSDLKGLQREVRDYEPDIALTPGSDGLIVIRRLLNESAHFLKHRGHLVMEIGFDQGEAVAQLIDPGVWRLLQIRSDLQGIPRIVCLQKAEN